MMTFDARDACRFTLSPCRAYYFKELPDDADGQQMPMAVCQRKMRCRLPPTMSFDI